jgi:hypothetical protein
MRRRLLQLFPFYVIASLFVGFFRSTHRTFERKASLKKERSKYFPKLVENILSNFLFHSWKHRDNSI